MSKKLRVCNVSDIPDNGMKDFDVDDETKILVINSGESYYAYNAICPHQDVCLGEGFYDGAVLTCHQHLWQWDITNGKQLGLAEAPLESYQVEIEDGVIYAIQTTALKSAQLFTDISDETLEQLEQIARIESYEVGSALYDIGDPTDDLYILESGRVEFIIGRDDRTSAAGFMLRKGEVFGWAALLEHQTRRIAKAVCREQSTLLRLNGKKTLEVLASHPESGYRVMRKLSTLITHHFTTPGET